MRNVLICTFFVVIFSASALAEDSGWQSFLDNDYDAAAVEFAKTSASDDYMQQVAMLSGKIELHKLLGEDELVVSEMIKLAGIPTESPVQALFLQRLFRIYEPVIAANSLLLDKLGLVLKEIVANQSAVHPMTKHVAKNLLARYFHDRDQFSEAQKLREAVGYLKICARVIGPVHTKDSYDAYEVLEPERNLLSNNSPHVDNVKLRVAKKLNLDEVLKYSQCDATYSLFAIESDADKEVVLSFEGGDGAVIWLEGYPVLHPDLFKNKYHHGLSRRVVRLHKGINRVVVKSEIHRSYILDFMALTGARAEGVRSLEFKESDWQGASCKNIAGKIFSRAWVEPYLTELKDNKSVFGRLLYIRSLFATTDYDKAYELLEDLQKEYKTSVFLKALCAGYKASKDYRTQDSTARMQKEAQGLYREILKAEPTNYLASINLALMMFEDGQQEQALGLLNALVEQYPSGVRLKLLLSEIYKNKNWLALAEKQINSLPAGMLQARYGFNLDVGNIALARSQVEEAWSKKLMSIYSYYSALMKLKDFKKASEILDRIQLENPEDDYYYHRKKDIAFEKGDIPAVKEALKQLLILDPTDFGLYIEFADCLIRTGALGDGRVEEVLDAFKSYKKGAIKFEEYKPRIEARVRDISGKTWGLLKYDIPLDQKVMKTVNKSEHKRANYALLLKVQARRFFEDLSSEKLSHTASMPFDRDGVGALSEFAEASGENEVLYRRTVDKDGKVFLPDSSDNIDYNKATSMYNVTPGSALDVAFHGFERHRQYFEETFYFQMHDVPIIRSRYVLVIPKKYKDLLSIESYPEDFLPEVTESENDITFVWNAENQEGIKEEVMEPDPQKKLRYVRVNIYSEDYYTPSLLSDCSAYKSEAAIKKKAKEIVSGALNDREKVQLIYKWICKNITDGRSSETARDVFRLKSGRPETTALLCQEMLAAVGLESWRVAVNPSFSRAGNGSREDRAKGVSAFSWWPVILRVKLKDSISDSWLSFTSQMHNMRFGDLGRDVLGAIALECPLEGVRLTRVKSEDFEVPELSERRYKFDTEGNVEVEAAICFYGKQAAEIRGRLENSTQAKRFVASMGGSIFNRIEDAKYTYPQVEDIQQRSGGATEAAVVKIKGRINKFCSRRNGGLMFQPFRAAVPSLSVPLPRKNDIEIYADILSNDSAKFIAPAGWAFSDVPQDIVLESKYGLYILDFSVKGDTLYASCSLIVPSQRVPAKECEAYNEFMAAMVEASKYSINLEKVELDIVEDVDYQNSTAAVPYAKFKPLIIPEKVREIISKPVVAVGEKKEEKQK